MAPTKRRAAKPTVRTGNKVTEREAAADAIPGDVDELRRALARHLGNLNVTERNVRRRRAAT